MLDTNPLFYTDGYKLQHHRMFPEETLRVYDNFTMRSFKHALPGITHGVYVGGKYVWKSIAKAFDEHFFKKDKAIALAELREEFSFYSNLVYDVQHFAALHDLGYLPLRVKHLPEGTLVPKGIPVMTIINTDADFYWLPNYLETCLSSLLWLPINSATIAYHLKKLLMGYAQKSDKQNITFVNFQAHDFCVRGMGGIQAAMLSGIGHNASFWGSDNIPSIKAIREGYGDEGFLIGGVPATEHSVMCAGEKDSEIETFRRLLKMYPTGILSVVSDTWDLWKVCTEYVTELKELILSRDGGKLVIRPDSGNPVDILCGKQALHEDVSKYYKHEDSPVNHPDYFYDFLLEEVREETPHGERGVEEYSNTYIINGKLYEATIHNISWNRYDKQYYFIEMWEAPKITVVEVELTPDHFGVIELLWNVFGGTVNEQGYKVLDSHIGAIYGDSITYKRATEICERLMAKGFATTNVVLGIGSYTYQYNTRDTLGMAMKATYIEVEETYLPSPESVEYGVRTVGREIFKDPITDDGMKKSAKGLLKVYRIEGAHGKSDLLLKDQCTWEEEAEGELVLLFEDGKFFDNDSFATIRARIDNTLK